MMDIVDFLLNIDHAVGKEGRISATICATAAEFIVGLRKERDEALAKAQLHATDAAVAWKEVEVKKWVMENPSDEMIVAGDERILEFLNDHTFALRPTTPAQECWKAMFTLAQPVDSGNNETSTKGE